MSDSAQSSAHGPLSDQIRVLHVDDDPDVRGLVAATFERRGDAIAVVTVSDGTTALDHLAEHDVDCVVSDYDMPGLDGLDLLREVRADYPDMPFVLLTGMGSERVASDAISAGANDYFRKDGSSEGLELLARRVENVVVSHRTESSYRELFENAAAGLALHDPQTGEFVDANRSAGRILGRDRTELLGGSIEDVATVPAQSDRERTLLAHLHRANADEAVALEERCRRPDGTRFWLHIQFRLLAVEGRTLALSQMRDVTERKRYEETLSALHASMAELAGATRPRQVVDCVTAAVEDLLAADRAAVFLRDPDENSLAVAAATTDWSPERPDDVAIPLSLDSPVTRAFIENTPTEATEMSVFGSDVRTQGRALLVPLGEHGVLAVGGDGTGFGEDDREFVEILASAATVALGRIRRDREIDSNREELRDRTDEVERLSRANSTLRDLGTALPPAETREDVYEAVCTVLDALDAVALAWVGVPDDEGGVDYPMWRGDVPEYLDSVCLDRDADEPAVVTARTGAPVRVDDVAVDLRREPWRQTALAHGLETARALPIEVDGVVCGVLSVLGADRAAFDGRFDDMLGAVAASASQRIYSLERHRGLLAPAATAVTYEVVADEHPLGHLTAELDCNLVVRGVVRKATDRHCVSLDVTGGDPDQVCALARQLAVVRNASVVSESEDGGRLDIRLETPLLGVRLPEHAVRVSRFLAGPSSVRATLTVARPDDVRAIAEEIRARYPTATLRSKRRRGDAPDDHERLLAFSESLTPRQREVTQVAHVNGFFDSPRRITGEELGEELGISAQAVHQHLRAAQRKLLDEVFEGSLDVSMTAQ